MAAIASRLAEIQKMTADARVRLEVLLLQIGALRAGLVEILGGDPQVPILGGRSSLPPPLPDSALLDGPPEPSENVLVLEDLEPLNEENGK